MKSVYIFGSYARGTAHENSDMDLLVDTAGSGLDTLFKLGALYEDLSNALSKKVDMITVLSIEQPAMRPSEIRFRENIIRERKSLYAVA